MDNEVALLKQKVKSLERQLCDRTRNYLYHFKKSPIKKCANYVDSSSQTDMISYETSQTQTNFNINEENHFANINIEPIQMAKLEQNMIRNQQNGSKTETLPQINNKKYKIQVLNGNDFCSNQKHDEEIKHLTDEIKSMKTHLQQTSKPSDFLQTKQQFYCDSSVCKTPCKDLQNTQFSKKKQIQTVSELSQSKFYPDSSIVSLEQDHLVKETKILKKQIRKLKKHIQNQLLISSETKQALLISEEENYKFRLQIQKLNKQIQILTGVFPEPQLDKIKPFSFLDQQPALQSIDSDQSQSTKDQLEKFKNQSQKYEEYISILQGVKRDYLKKCIQAKEQICNLKQQNQSLKIQINQLKQLLQKKQPEKSLTSSADSKDSLLSQKTWSEWSQIIKSKIHQISNCLPLVGNHEQFLFRPDNIQDMVSMLERILQFCKKIQVWQKQRIRMIEQQRANLLKILSSLLVKHPQTKQTIADQILGIQELKYLVNFMNKQPKSAQRSRQQLDLQQVITQTDSPDVIQTN